MTGKPATAAYRCVDKYSDADCALFVTFSRAFQDRIVVYEVYYDDFDTWEAIEIGKDYDVYGNPL